MFSGGRVINYLAILALTILMTLPCASPPAVEEGFLDVNGTRLFFKAMGSGEPIVVLHGGPGFDHRQFLPDIIEGSELVIAENSGHWLFVDATETFSTSVGEFLDGVDGNER
jgi:pimeloyl-ACP methyl ester carboxylesterase